MVALLVSLSIMAVLMTVVMPAWKQRARREKEAELAFRGEQYTHAIALFQRKHGPGTLPPNLDVLLSDRYLRKKYKDPITNDDFLVLTQGAPGAAATPGRSATPPVTTQPGAGLSPLNPLGGRGSPGAPPTVGRGGVIGVQSKSKDQSIRLYKGASHYIEWPFIFQPQIQTPGAGAPGTTAPGQRGRGAPGSPTGPQIPGGGIGGGPGRGNPPPGGRGLPQPIPPGGRGRGPGG